MATHLDDGKQLFWGYACSHFFMTRDGVLEQYRALGGSVEHEAGWRADFIAHWQVRLDTTDLTALRWLMDAKASEVIVTLFRMGNYGDHYVKFWYAYALAALSRAPGARDPDRTAGLNKAIALWAQILEQPNRMSEEHRQAVDAGMLAALKARGAEEYVRNYAGKLLREMSHIGPASSLPRQRP